MMVVGLFWCLVGQQCCVIVFLFCGVGGKVVRFFEVMGVQYISGDCGLVFVEDICYEVDCYEVVYLVEGFSLVYGCWCVVGFIVVGDLVDGVLVVGYVDQFSRVWMVIRLVLCSLWCVVVVIRQENILQFRCLVFSYLVGVWCFILCGKMCSLCSCVCVVLLFFSFQYRLQVLVKLNLLWNRCLGVCLFILGQQVGFCGMMVWVWVCMVMVLIRGRQCG